MTLKTFLAGLLMKTSLMMMTMVIMTTMRITMREDSNYCVLQQQDDDHLGFFYANDEDDVEC